ncbi:MAG: T9SS type A sorting domain-containing protein [Flavobacteriales bacterium]|nr:T9SS type A sorting domain-containing protein [Flavobacteriales bacterium]
MKQIAIVLLVFFFSSHLSAQESESWPRPGAEWNYCVYGDYPSFNVWSHTFAYTADTVIGSHTYAMVQHTEVNGEPLAEDGSSWFILEEYTRTYFRQSGDTVYRRVNGQDYVFMINGIVADEEFTTFRSTYNEWGQWSCTDELPLKVIATEETEYGDATYREVSLQDLDPFFNTENSMENTYVFIEGVGLKNGFTYLTPELIYEGETNQSDDLAECLGGVLHLPWSALHHYSDNETEIDFFECDITVSTDDVTADRAFFRLFPNPAKDIVTIETTGDAQLRLQVRMYDMRGMLLKQYVNVMSGTQLDLGKLTRGIYTVSVESDSGVATQKLVIQ